jgi:UDP-2,3-diacylglucosamine pyrophosphatase LpxH
MTKYRSIWISDVHLGTNSCQADSLCKFLKHNTCDQLYLVGDIIDGWKLKRSWNWPQSHSNVIRRLLTCAKRGTAITYITGNHDEFLRSWTPFNIKFGNISVVDHCNHIGLDGTKYLVIHGDLFDTVTVNYKWISLLGDIAYELLIRSNTVLNNIRKWFGLGYWSLSRYIKSNAKQATNFIFKFESHLAKHAADNQCIGVFCGHIHQPEIKMIDGIVYMNSGDFVESISALVERHDGIFELLVQGVDGEMKVEKTYNPFKGEIT